MASFITGIRLPEDVERGALGGARFNTTVLELDSGFEKRNQNWSQSRGEWDVGYGLVLKFQEDPASMKLDLDDLINFFYTVRGKAFSWRFKDWSDYEVGFQNGSEVTAQFLAFGDGSTVAFQAFKRYAFGSGTAFDRTLTKTVAGTSQIFIEGAPQTEGVDYTIDDDTGIITFTVAPAATGGTGPGGAETVTYRIEFDVHARFDTDDLKISMETFNAGAWPNIPIVELRGTGL